jgi:GntR family transcriptional regulator, transcriptional repressor for pyruvate dehydrogenase complex
MEQISRGLKKGKLSERVRDELIKIILNGEFRDKNFLPPEGELCDRFQVSRATVREAVGSLVDMGFIERLHGIGLKITDNSIQVVSNSLNNMMQRTKADYKDILEIRGILEIQIARLAALRADAEDISNLEKTIKVMDDAKSSFKDYLDNDFKFHLYLSEASKNIIIISIIKALQPLLRNLFNKIVKEKHRTERNRKFHKKILSAIKKRDPEIAARSMREHLEATAEMTEKASKY